MGKLFRVSAIIVVSALAAGIGMISGPVSAKTAAEAPPSIVEDFSYPDAEGILTEQNVKLISGDGKILLVDCATPAEGDIGLLKVWTTDRTIGADGVGRVCFKLSGPTGLLNLVVPGVFEIRGDGQRTGTGHEVTATVQPEGGRERKLEVEPDGATGVGLGADPDAPPTVLLRLLVTG